MSKRAIIELIVALIAFVLFLVSWLVFKNVTSSDWVILVVGCLDLVAFFLALHGKLWDSPSSVTHRVPASPQGEAFGTLPSP